MILGAEIVITERLDHAALGCRAAASCGDHASQFDSQGLKLSDLGFDSLQLVLRNGVGGLARAFRVIGQVEQVADGVDRETQLARVLDEREPSNGGFVVDAAVALGPAGL